MANPNVFAALARPRRTAVEYAGDNAALAGAQKRNALADLAMQQQQQQMSAAAEADAAMRAAYATDDPSGAMMRSGVPSVVQAAQAQQAAQAKARLDASKTTAGIDKSKAETLEKQLGTLATLAQGVLANPSQQSAMAALDQWQQFTGLDSAADRQAIAQMTSPERVRQWAAGKALKAQELLPKLQAINTGQRTEFVDTNAVTNPAPQALQMQATPGQVMAQQTQLRGQNLTDARARQTLQQSAQQFNARMAAAAAGGGAGAGASGGQAAAGGGIGAMGKVTEGERNNYGYAKRMAEATKLLDKYEEKGRPSYGTNMAESLPMVGEFARRASMNETQAMYRQAAEDWVRAKLRKESGAAIGAHEMQAEIETYFPQPGEPKGVVDQKRRAREIATQAMTAAAGQAWQRIEGSGGAPSSSGSGALTPGEKAERDALRKRLGM